MFEGRLRDLTLQNEMNCLAALSLYELLSHCSYYNVVIVGVAVSGFSINGTLNSVTQPLLSNLKLLSNLLTP